MAIPATSLTLACRTQGAETHTSKTLRITGVALGAVALTVGVVALSGVFGAAPAAITAGGTLVGFGLACMVAASILKSVSQSAERKPPQVSSPMPLFLSNLHHIGSNPSSDVDQYSQLAQGYPTFFNERNDLFIPCKVQGPDEKVYRLEVIYQLNQELSGWNRIALTSTPPASEFLTNVFPTIFDEVCEPSEIETFQKPDCPPAELGTDAFGRHLLIRLLSGEPVVFHPSGEPNQSGRLTLQKDTLKAD